MKSCYTIPIGDTCAIADVCDYYGEGVIISRISVPEKFRMQGYGQALLNQIFSEADNEHTNLYLEIASSDGPSYDELMSWYARNGFREWNGIFRRRPKRNRNA